MNPTISIRIVASEQQFEIGTPEGLYFSGVIDGDGHYHGTVNYDGGDLPFVERLLDDDDRVIRYAVA